MHLFAISSFRGRLRPAACPTPVRRGGLRCTPDQRPVLLLRETYARVTPSRVDVHFLCHYIRIDL